MKSLRYAGSRPPLELCESQRQKSLEKRKTKRVPFKNSLSR